MTSQAVKQLSRIGKDFIPKIVGQIDALKFSPFPIGCKKLQGFSDVFRIRIGPYRVIYQVQKKEIIILILKIGHRKDIYKNI